jgi:hypothetical protein
MKSSIFWDIKPSSPLKVKRRFGGAFRLHLQGGRISPASNQGDAGRKQSNQFVKISDYIRKWKTASQFWLARSQDQTGLTGTGTLFFISCRFILSYRWAKGNWIAVLHSLLFPILSDISPPWRWRRLVPAKRLLTLYPSRENTLYGVQLYDAWRNVNWWEWGRMRSCLNRGTISGYHARTRWNHENLQSW